MRSSEEADGGRPLFPPNISISGEDLVSAKKPATETVPLATMGEREQEGEVIKKLRLVLRRRR